MCECCLSNWPKHSKLLVEIPYRLSNPLTHQLRHGFGSLSPPETVLSFCPEKSWIGKLTLVKYFADTRKIWSYLFSPGGYILLAVLERAWLLGETRILYFVNTALSLWFKKAGKLKQLVNFYNAWDSSIVWNVCQPECARFWHRSRDHHIISASRAWLDVSGPSPTIALKLPRSS